MGKWRTREDSNLWPLPSEGSALSSWATGAYWFLAHTTRMQHGLQVSYFLPFNIFIKNIASIYTAQNLWPAPPFGKSQSNRITLTDRCALPAILPILKAKCIIVSNNINEIKFSHKKITQKSHWNTIKIQNVCKKVKKTNLTLINCQYMAGKP